MFSSFLPTLQCMYYSWREGRQAKTVNMCGITIHSESVCCISEGSEGGNCNIEGFLTR